MLLLAASLALLVGPVCTMLGERSRAASELFDGFSLVVIGGICLLVVMPHVVEEIGFFGLVLALVGLLLPWLGHRFGHGRFGSLWLVGLAVSAHLVMDGAVLALEDHSGLLPWAVVLHRLPVGFAVAVAVQGAPRPIATVWGVALAMIGATAAGFFAGPTLVASVPHWAVGGMEALVAGGLLHVALNAHGKVHACDGHAVDGHGHGESCSHDHAHDAHGSDAHGHAHEADAHSHDAHGHHGHGETCSHGHAHEADAQSHDAHDHHGHGETCGHDHGHSAHEVHDHHSHAHSHAHTHAHAHAHAHDASGELDPVQTKIWAAAGTLFGVLAMVAGPMVSPDVVGSNVTTFLRTLGVLLLESAPALLLGYALAGLVPFLLTASRAAALGRGSRLSQSLKGVAFGLPLPVCSCGVLPLYESLIRRGAPPVAAMAFFVATPELGLDAVLLSVPLLGTSLTVARVVAAFLVAVIVAHLVGRHATASKGTGGPIAEVPADQPLGQRIRSGLRFGFVELFDHTMPWIALGLIIAAAAEPLLSHGSIASIPTALQVPLAALIGVPVYVCASGATPIAALAIHKGLSTGAAMAFLIAGPATNVTTFGVLARLHGRRVALLFGVSVTALAVIAGWTIDLIGVSAVPVLEGHAAVDAHGSWFSVTAVVVLSVLVVASLVRQGPRGAIQQILDPIHVH